MGKDIISSKEFIESEAFLQLQEMAENSNLYLMPFSFDFKNKISPYYGTYLVIMPEKGYSEAIVNDRENFIRLLKTAKNMGEECFNPYFNIINISEYNRANNALSMYMHTVREIDRSSVVVNAFRELGYKNFPTFIDDFSCEQIRHLRNMCFDERLTPRVRERYIRAYPAYIESLYEQFTGSKTQELLPRAEKQTCSKEFFADHNIPVIYERMDLNFRAHFLLEVADHPQFLYWMSEKPVLDLKDAAHLYDGNVLDNPLGDQSAEKKWDIAFPVVLQDVFYGIMNRYNTQFCTQKADNILDIGNPADLFTIHVMREDIYFFDELCSSRGVRFYINSGDLEYLDVDATRNILLAVNKKDADDIAWVCEQIMRDGTHDAFLPKDLGLVKRFRGVQEEREISIDAAKEAIRGMMDPLDVDLGM